MQQKKFTLNRAERQTTSDPERIERFVAGQEPEAETTKTFRLPLSLSRKLKLHAVQTGQTEKEILVRLISNYLKSHG
jgi:hypothetical protein